MRQAIALVALGCWACGTSAPAVKHPVYTSDDGSGGGGTALTPDQYEQINTLIHQKIRVVSVSCYDGELNKLKNRKFFGNVTLNIHITTTGRATETEVKETTLPDDGEGFVEAKANVESCLGELIKTWEFGVEGADGWFLYTFHFEPQY